MQKPVEFKIDPGVLDTDAGIKDRFVYTPTFAPYDPFIGVDEGVILPDYQIDYTAVASQVLPVHALDPEWVKRYDGLDERIAETRDAVATAHATEAAAVPPSIDRVKQGQREVIRLGQAMREAIDSGETRVVSALGTELGQVAESLSYAATAAVLAPARPPGSAAAYPPIATATPAGPSGTGATPPSQELSALTESTLGYLFLDRTRITPIGFALGEHLHSLSLAPGEEVILEEKVYSKREQSFESSSEQEQTTDTELSSTLTTELAEGMNSERSHSGTNANTMGVNVGGNIDGITFNVGPTWSSNVQDADRSTTTDSVKSSQSASTKVAARNRSQHKIVFKVSTESRFESTSRRTIRNPNVNTPIDLQYFKVLQRLRLSHERYGVRLCWAPAVADPAGDLFRRLEAARTEIYNRAAAATAGPRPTPPQRATPTNVAPKDVPESVNADAFDWAWGGQSHNYEVLIQSPSGLEWDRRDPSLTFSFTSRRPAGAFLVTALPSGTGVRVIVHVGVVDCRDPRMLFNPSLKPFFGEPTGTFTFTVSARFVPPAVPVGDPVYDAALKVYQEQSRAWEEADQKAKAEARQAADAEWAALVKDALANTNVMNETLGSIIRAFFSPLANVQIRQVDIWEDLFDWKNAALRLYPSWWAAREPRDPHAAPDSFVNASWGRLYLPIRAGVEDAALRWIYERVMSGKGSAKLEAFITQLVKELKAYRRTNFGTEDEIQTTPKPGEPCPDVSQKYVCLGHWDETLPTDGTHCEVMQAQSSAADDYARSLLDDAAKLRAEQIARAQSETALREKAAKDGLGDITTTIDVNVGDDDDDTKS